MTPVEAANAFVEAVNSGEADRIARRMTRDHRFIDASGMEVTGRDRMTEAWRIFLHDVPDYRVEVGLRFADGDTVILLGRASGTVIEKGELRPENRWEVPAAWRAVTRSDLVATWQLYADQYRLRRICERIFSR